MSGMMGVLLGIPLGIFTREILRAYMQWKSMRLHFKRLDREIAADNKRIKQLETIACRDRQAERTERIDHG